MKWAILISFYTLMFGLPAYAAFDMVRFSIRMKRWKRKADELYARTIQAAKDGDLELAHKYAKQHSNMLDELP